MIGSKRQTDIVKNEMVRENFSEKRVRRLKSTIG
jgi:hypothetical protein